MPAVKLPPCVYHERRSAWTVALPTMAHRLAAICVLGEVWTRLHSAVLHPCPTGMVGDEWRSRSRAPGAVTESAPLGHC